VKYLLSKGCRFDILDSDGNDGLHYAVKNNDALLVNLIKLGKDTNGIKIDLKDAQGNTAVHYCV